MTLSEFKEKVGPITLKVQTFSSSDPHWGYFQFFKVGANFYKLNTYGTPYSISAISLSVLPKDVVDKMRDSGYLYDKLGAICYHRAGNHVLAVLPIAMWFKQMELSLITGWAKFVVVKWDDFFDGYFSHIEAKITIAATADLIDSKTLFEKLKEKP